MGDGAMQLILTFTTRELLLPMAHRHMIQAMLYHALRQDDSAHSARLHDQGREADGRRFKLFTFGPLRGPYSLEDQRIRFHGDVRLEVRSPDVSFIQALLRGFPPGSRHRLAGGLMAVADCCIGTRSLDASSLRVETLSPVVARITQEDGRPRFYSPAEEPFYTLVQTNARRKWDSFRPQTPCPPFSLRLAEGCAPQKQVTWFKGSPVNAWFGSFHMSGSPDLLSFLYDTGLGAKSSQGFGMFEPV